MTNINAALKIGGVILAVAVVYKIANLPPRSFVSQPSDEYDFIIVGGGSAGCVLAARLSKHYHVLLVEAGGQFGYLSAIPLAAPFLQETEYDWKFRAEAQTNSSWGLVERVPFWPRGKGLGGTGQINYLLHYPGRKEDWASWISNGAEGWSSSLMAHYMAKLTGARYRNEDFEFEEPLCQNNTVVTCRNEFCLVNSSKVFTTATTCSPHPPKRVTSRKINRAVKQDKGSILTNKEDPYTNHLLNAFIGASQELKHLRLIVSPAESTVKSGRRWSSLQSHLLPVAHRDTLDILLHAEAQRVIFTKEQGEAPKANGVKISSRGKEWSVKARHDVIVSAGPIGSPQLLQLSGVGPKKLLEQLKIDIIADAPVGSNLHDQLNVPLYVSLTQPVSLTLTKVLKVAQVLKYVLMGKGMFTTPGVAGIASSSGNIGIILFGMGSTEDKLLRVISNYQSHVFSSIFPQHKNHSAEGFVFLVSCLQPRSRGYVHIRSTDPSDQAKIDPNYLADPYDLECTRRGVKLAKRLVMTEPFKRLGAKLHLPVLGECYDYEVNINDNDYLNCMIRTVGITSYHPAGTVAMGNQTHSVLDSSFRVNNVQKLRVVDSSVFPTPFSGTPHSALLAIAERAARMIEAEANYTTSRKV